MKNENLIRQIAGRINELGGRALCVGGCVRDELLSIDCYDIDCEVHGLEAERLRALLSEFGDIDESGSAYGVYTLKGAGLDFALPRRETKTGPSHKDFVVQIDPDLSEREAAARRDFTVNAIMCDALTGEYVDPYGGMQDLQDGVLRAMPGDHFEEDPLRVLRGAQFAARFHLAPDETTILRMRRMPLDHLSAARVMDETKKALLKADCPGVFFSVLLSVQALEPWFHELDEIAKREPDEFESLLRLLSEAAKEREKARDALGFMLASLCVFLPEDQRGSLLTRLGVRRQTMEYAMNLCGLYAQYWACKTENESDQKAILFFDQAVCARDLFILCICGQPDTEKQKCQKAFAAYERAAKRPMPDAKMLMEAGILPGPQLGMAVRAARKFVLLGEDIHSAIQKAADSVEK